MAQTVDNVQLPVGVKSARLKGSGRVAEMFSSGRGKPTGFTAGLHAGTEGAYWGIPTIALSASAAQRGEMIPSAIAGGFSLAAQPVLSGAISAGIVSLVGCPPAAAGLAAVVLAGMATSRFEHTLIRTFKSLTVEGSQAQNLQFGSGFKDSASAQQRRQRAVMEMTGALSTSRRWLGQEALHLHNR